MTRPKDRTTCARCYRQARRLKAVDGARVCRQCAKTLRDAAAAAELRHYLTEEAAADPQPTD